ncbi:unnamed protein product [Brugia timori]|uniref:Uncharacterized protein n=1 Tax=Brugia timori TaxID=42155 RepID=A0A0R3QD79_9BILA|nr:unnamed protein product [Brugia timori]
MSLMQRVPAQRPSKLSGAAGLSPGGGQHFAHILQTLEESEFDFLSRRRNSDDLSLSKTAETTER